MSAGHAQRLQLRLFLEGVEIPIIAAQVSASPNRPSMASIQIPPLSEGTRFHPRTLVHLYFLDPYAASSPIIDATIPQQAKETKDPTTADKESDGPTAEELVNTSNQTAASDSFNRNYKLLFVGEIIGFQWTKNARQRSLVLQCADLSNYWDYAFQWNNTGLFGPGLKAVFSGGATNLFTDFLSTKGSVLTAIVSSGRCNTFPKLTGLAAGIIRLIEAIGGTYFPRPGSKAKKVRGQNLFFSMAELRLHITQMIGAVEADPTSRRLISRQGYSGMFDRALGGLGQQTSIRDAINAMTKIVFHETYPQPCPMYIPGSSGAVSGSKVVKVKGHPQWGFIADRAQTAIDGLATAAASLQRISDEADFLDSSGIGTRGAVLSVQKKLIGIRKELYKTLTRIRSTPQSQPPANARALYIKASQFVGKAALQVAQWRPKAPATIKDRPFKSINDALVQLNKLANLTTYDIASSQVEPARLIQQILRPDIWFGAAPRCNVLFPEAYHTLQYRRSFLEEPTRFLLKTNDEVFGEDELFDRFYFAPRATTVKGDKVRLQDMMRGAVFDHELFTGILPVFEKMGEFNVFANKSGTVTAQGGVAKAGPAQRSTNFLYFKHRYNARVMQIQGKFNPFIAVGFPGVIIDKYVDAATVKLHNELKLSAKHLGLTEEQVGSVLGTNFLGNFTQVVHMVSQEGAQSSTEIVASYCRQPEEGIEFLGLPEEAQKVYQRDTGDAVRATDIAAINPPRLFSFGPNYGRITNVQDVTNSYLRRGVGTSDVQDNKKLPLFDIQTSPKRRDQSPTLVPISLFAFPANEFGSEVVELTGDPNRLVRFRAYRVTEEVPRYRKEDATLPIEEFIRPGWYGDLWTTSKIGKVYNDFFGIGSITDAQTIVSPNGASFGQSSEAQENAVASASKAEDSADPRKDEPAALALDEGATVQSAVEFLWLTYSYIKQQGLDVEEFIRSYTWRPVATLLDMFGTSDLAFSPAGDRVVSGTEGFHSKAFGPHDDLFGLVGPEVETILGISRGTVTAQRADTRKRKLERVLAYSSAIKFSRAILG